ncbi:MAG: orotate phosphoribosyltransferase [archaeon]
MIEELLGEVGAVKFGEFTWKSGKQAPYYVDLRILPSFPEAFKIVASQMAEAVKKIPDYQSRRLVGVPLSGISFATAVGLELNMPVLFARKEAKGHGTKKLLEGIFKAGDRVILIEDVISTGVSSSETISKLKEGGLAVEDIVAVLEHGIGGRENLHALGLRVHTLTNMTKIVKRLSSGGKVPKEKVKTVEEFVKAALTERNAKN